MIKHKDYQISIVDKFGVVLYRYCGDNYKINFYELGLREYSNIYNCSYIELPLLIDEFTKHYIFNTEFNTVDHTIRVVKYLRSILCANGNKIEIMFNKNDKIYLYCMEELYSLDVFDKKDFYSDKCLKENFMKIYFNNVRIKY